MATKTIKFDDVTEKKLLEFLQTLPHGDFSKKTKRFWLREFAEVERKKSQSSSFLNALGRSVEDRVDIKEEEIT